LGLILYLPALKAGFLYDDYTVIVDNSALRSGNFLNSIITVGKEGIRKDMFRPVAMLSFYFNYKINNLSPLGYRIFNILLGVINSYILYLLLSAIFPSLDKRIARASAVLFLVSPLNNQALLYISSRFTLLVSLFFLLSFYFYIKKKIFLTGGCFLLGLFAKEEMLIFPLILGIYELCAGRNCRYYFETLVVIAGAVIVFLFARFLSLGLFIWDKSYASFNWKFLPAQMGFFIYNLKTVFSSPVVMHDLRALNLSFYFFLVLVFILLGVYLTSRRKKSGALFLFPWLLILSFSPFLNGPHRAMEYRFYLPNTFYLLLLVTIFKKVTPKLNLKLYYGFIAFSLWFSFFRVLEYRDNLMLWANTTKRYPRLSEAHVNYGRELCERGLYQSAVIEFKRAIKLAPWDYFAFYNLGLAYVYMENYHRAKEAFSRAIQIAPSYAPAHYNLGLTYLILGDKIKARKEFIKARELGWEVKIPWEELEF
jgi:tetratricopeptide (TPR) repeat protein